MRKGIYFTCKRSEARFAAANKVFGQLSGLRDKLQDTTKTSYSRVWKARQEIYDLPATLSAMAFASRNIFDLALEEVDYWISKKAFLEAGALFQKLPWWAIYPEGFGVDQLRAATQQEANRFRIDLVQKTVEARGLEITEELIRILSACESPSDEVSVRIVNGTIDEIKDRSRAFELGSYWNTCPYFVCWDSKQNIGKIYSINPGAYIQTVSNEKLNELYLEVSK